MDKKDLENNNPQISAMEAFRKTQKQIDEIKSAIGLPHEALKAFDSLNIFKQSTAFASVQKLAEQFPYISTLDQLSKKPEIKSAMDDFNESMVSYRSLLESLASNRELINNITDSFKAVQSYQETLPLKELYSQNLINQLNITNEISALKNLDFIKGLSSFQSIARMKNFPTEAIDVSETLESLPRLNDKDMEAIKELDAEFNDELSTIEDFNELSEERRSALLALHKNYYIPILLQALVILLWWKTCLDEKIDLSNMTFIFVENTKQAFSYINYQPNFSSILDSIIGSAIFMVLVKIFKYIKNLSK